MALRAAYWETLCGGGDEVGRAAHAVWAVAEADGGNVEALDGIGVPPVWGAEEGDLLVDGEFLEQVRYTGVEKAVRARHGEKVGGKRG